MASSNNLLNIEPEELSFRIELMKQASCTIRLSSNSRSRVAFKILRESRISGEDRSSTVTMGAPVEVLPNMECKDKFLIKSVLASPDDTLERTQKSFNERGLAVEDYILRVVYIFPSHEQPSNFDTSGQVSSLDRSIMQERSLSGTQGMIERLVDNSYVKGIASLFLSLILLYLIMKILPVIWSWTLVATLLVIKMAKRLVSDSVEDWVVRTLVYVCVHFITLVFQRKGNVSGHESGVSVAR